MENDDKFRALLVKAVDAMAPFAAVLEHDISVEEMDVDQFQPIQFYNRSPKISVGNMRTLSNVRAEIFAALWIDGEATAENSYNPTEAATR